MSRAKRYSDFIRLCLLLAGVVWATVAGSSIAAAQAPPPAPNTSIFGPNVYVMTPSMSPAAINAQLNALNQEAQFSTNRYAVMFQPGTYGTTSNPVTAQVGFYEQISGLGTGPTGVAITGGFFADQLINGNMTQNFWRSLENMSEQPASGPDGILDWGVSQGASLRRMDIQGALTLANSQPINGANACQESSGGFIADSYVLGLVNACSQQQWYTRNSDLVGGFTGFVWNFVFSGVTNAPAQSYPGGPSGRVNITNLASTPISVEKPFLFMDGSGNYNVFKPTLQTNSSGLSWSPSNNGTGFSLPITTFFIAEPSTGLSQINNALANGVNVILTPGIYKYNGSIDITQPDTIVLGLGYATIVPQTGTPAITVADVDGVRIAGLMIDAGPLNSSVLLQIGNPGGANIRHTSNPTVLNDVFFRIGGGTAGSATTSLQVDSSDVILDNIWAWRADHGNPGTVGWTTNTAAHGVVVNGSYVTALGLAVEHYQQEQVLWNGDGGKTIFYQSELPYDVPSQAAWSRGSTNGYPSYVVSPASVCNHKAYGLGIYSFFNQGINIVDDNAMTAPNSSGVSITDVGTVFLNGSGQISNIVNGTGGPANSSNSGKLNPLASYTGTGSCVLPTGNFLPPPNSSSNYNPNNFDTANTIQEMIHPHSDLVLLMSHRGVHNTINPAIVNYIPAPENSLESIGLTATLGYEGAEVDIKLSSDGVPMLSHDTSLGREALCPGCNTGDAFNPFGANTPANQANNPAISSLTEAQAKQFELYTVQNPELPTQPVASLQDLLTYMTANKIAIVLALDIKDIPAAQACWQVVKANNDYLGRPYYKSVLFKVAGVIFSSPAQFESTFGSDYPNVLYWPYYTTNQIAPKFFGSEAGMISSLQSWQASGVSMVGTEVNIKEPGGILTQMLGAAKTYNGTYTTGVGSFSPTAEFLASPGGAPEFFYGKDTSTTFSGYCCYTLQDILYNGSGNGQQSDTADDRGDVYFLLQSGINVITTDEVTTVAPLLAQEGLRNTSHLSVGGGGQQTLANGIYTITNIYSTANMGVPASSPANSQAVTQQVDNGGSNQQWQLTYLDNGLYQLTSVYSGLCLDVYGGSVQPGATLDQYTCTAGYTNQQFILSATSDGYYTIVGSQSRLAVEVPGPTHTPGTVLDQGTLNGATNQEWAFHLAGPVVGSYIITNANSGLAMDVSGDSISNSAAIDQWTPNGQHNQIWNLSLGGITIDGQVYYELTSASSGRCLDVYGGSVATGATLDQYVCTAGYLNQQFAVSPAGDGNYMIVGRQSGLAVEVPKLSTTPGTVLDQWTVNGGANQAWTFTPTSY